MGRFQEWRIFTVRHTPAGSCLSAAGITTQQVKEQRHADPDTKHSDMDLLASKRNLPESSLG